MTSEDQATEARARLFELLKTFRTAMLVTRTADGRLRARPLSLALPDGEGPIYFATSVDSPKLDELEAMSDDVLITLQETNRYISISGTARVTRERQLIDQLWNESWRVWFPGSRARRRQVRPGN